MMKVMTEKNLYLDQFEQLEQALADREPAALRRLRKAAIARFAELGFPTARNEDWKFTSVAPITRVPFQPARPDASGITAGRMRALIGPTGPGPRLVFLDGEYLPEFSTSHPLFEGAAVGSLLAAIQANFSDWVEPHLARHARHQDHAFTALNTALFRNGAFILVPKNASLSEPIHLIFVSTAPAEPTVAHPRNLIITGPNSRATLVEQYVHLDEGQTFTNAVSEIVAGENAVIDHYKLQGENRQAFHVATTQVYQGRGSKFSTHYIGSGGSLVRNEVRVLLDAEGCEATVNGLYLASGTQHMDNHTVIDHAKPHCASHELYKGILDGKAKGVFNGKIFVRQDAQKTDAKQTNQTLLLSDEATINTKPQLEIYADDVKCTHGATVGNLDAEAIFYLRSRGIGLEQARGLLTFAFANDIVSRIQVGPIRLQLERQLLAARHLPLLEEAP
jgi:Fe-S cluster assembly protein SufD